MYATRPSDESENMSTNTPDKNLAELLALLRVVADERRLRILALLMQQEACVCDIMEQLGLSQSLASHHLGVLRRAGLIRDRHEAQWVYYSVDPEQLAELNARYLALLDVANLTPEAAYGAAPHKC
jgi:DNA-binding transcriptional ArsR family regulator